MSASLKSVFALAALAAALAFAAPAGAQQVKNLKMQSTWPASLTLQDHFKFLAERIDKLTAGQIKIEALAAGQVVPAFEILDATHKKVIDGGHGVAYYWVGKNKTAVLFTGGPGGNFGMDFVDVDHDLFDRLLQLARVVAAEQHLGARHRQLEALAPHGLD